MKAKWQFGCASLVVLAFVVAAGCTMITPAETKWTDGKVVACSHGQGFYEVGLGADVGKFSTVSVGSATAKTAGSVKGTGVEEVSTGDNVTHLTTITGQAASVVPALVTPKP